jgi:serine/threonine-protein kinase
MVVASVPTFVQALTRSRLLEPAQLDEVVQSLQTRYADPKALADDLARRRWLTPYQVEQLLRGRGQDLVLGHYVLLDSLGEGGMGQVFKARHRRLERVVALKVIRPERLASPDAVRRFEREARAAARLTHPNIVTIYDADEVNGTHFIAMELIEGIDLDRLVTEHGPLPVGRACVYIKEAALGLQHAHEKGLVHRDIKPANLLVSYTDSQVKLLDLGLARLDSGQITGPLTQEGVVMGTLDYLAPEQALDSHKADIRADIYSLGCSLYYLLTGRPPFPGGTVTQKLIWHQQAEPTPVTRLRADVPAAVAAVLRKMLAKRPEERYQTPGEVVLALEPFCRASEVRPPPITPADRPKVAVQTTTVTRPPSGTVATPSRPSSGMRRNPDEMLPEAGGRQSWFRRYGLGGIACAMTVSSGVFLFLLLLVAVVVMKKDGNSPAMAMVGFLMFGAMAVAGIGGVLGLVGTFLPGSNKPLSIAGACVGALVIFGMLGLMCLGMMS